MEVYYMTYSLVDLEYGAISHGIIRDGKFTCFWAELLNQHANTFEILSWVFQLSEESFPTGSLHLLLSLTRYIDWEKDEGYTAVYHNSTVVQE